MFILKFEETILKGSYLIKLDPICDSRGFSRVFCKKFKEINLIMIGLILTIPFQIIKEL